MEKNIFTSAMSLFERFVSCNARPTRYTAYVDMDICYTGAIIDCRGLGLSMSISPVIEDTAGHKLYGHKNLDCDKVIQKGMAGYATSFNDAAIARAGNNPIVLKAIGVNNHGITPVIDQADAALLKYSALHNDYFRDAAIVFIM